MDFHKYSLSKLAFMLNVTCKSENKTYLLVYGDLSRHATWHQRSYQIALKQGDQGQHDCKLFFRLDGTCNSQWSNYLTQRAEILSRRSNLTSQRAKNTVNDLSVVSVVPKSLSTWSKLKQVGFTVSSLFFPRPASCSRQFTWNGSNFAHTSLLLKTLRQKRWSLEVRLDW